MDENLEIVVDTNATAIRAAGQANQILATISVTNTGQNRVTLGGTDEELANLLGISIADSTVESLVIGGLMFLLTNGPNKRGQLRNAQFDLEGRSYELLPDDVAKISIRLIQPPGEAGSFLFKIRDHDLPITIEAVE